MSEAMLALLGFATIIIVIALLLRNVTVPALAFVSVSTVTGAILVATGTFTIEEMGEFVTAGVAGVHGTAALFIFSVLFFGIMTDVGMFDKIINALMKKVGSNVVGVAMMTCIIAMIGHLDGGGASTFLITIPAMLPVYKRLNMRPTTLMLICVSAMGVMNVLEICQASDRLFGIALSGGDYTKDLQTTISGTGVELAGARQQLIIAARAAGVQCFDTVFTNLDDMEAFEEEVKMIKQMGFDGKSIVNPRQIPIVHEIYTPTEKEIIFAEKVVKEIDEKKAQGIGVFTVDGKMIDIAFYDGAKRTIELAKASGVYKGDL